MSTIAPSTVEDEVTCHGLLLALVATQLRTAWHAGAVDADSAMRCLDKAIRTICEIRISDPCAMPIAGPAQEDGHAPAKAEAEYEECKEVTGPQRLHPASEQISIEK